MLKVGAILHGVYRIERYLSSGGFGNTYVATNVEFDEVVAIKEFFIKGVTQRNANNTTVSVSNAENEVFFQGQMQKFKKEARRLRRLRNSHIVSVHDLFEENGTAYYVMDYIDGENLSVRLRRIQRALSEKEVKVYLPQILDALKCVHNEGLWHLDLKPANIMVDRQGNVTLIDFGASKQRDNRGGATTSTAVSFTNGFAPREQMEQNLEKFGPWTDLYALGATLYNLLANQRPPLPSDIDDDRSVDKHLALPLPANVSQSTRHLILWLMKTNRFERPQSVEDVSKMMKKSDVVTATPIIREAEEEDDHTLVFGKDPQKEVHSFEKKTKIENSQGTGFHSQNKTSKPLWKKKMIFTVLGSLLFVIIMITAAYISHIGNSETTVTTDTIEAVVDSVAEVVDSFRVDVSAMPFHNALGDFTYTGEVNEDQIPQGKGMASFKNGNYYEGLFKNGNLDGKDGSFTFDNGDIFVGSFKNNYFSEGTYYVKETGEFFKGTFKNGNPADGTWYDKYGKILEEI